MSTPAPKRLNTNYRRGARIEQRAVELLRKWGYQAKRSPSSAGLWDVRGDNDSATLLISCKLVRDHARAAAVRRAERRILLGALHEAYDCPLEDRNTPKDRYALLRRKEVLLELWVYLEGAGWYCQETIKLGEAP